MVVRYSSVGDFHPGWFAIPWASHREPKRLFGVWQTDGMPRPMSKGYIRNYVRLLVEESIRTTSVLAAHRTIE